MPLKLQQFKLHKTILRLFLIPSAGTTYICRDQYTNVMKNFSTLDVPSVQKQYSLAHWLISEKGIYQDLTPFLYLLRTSRIHWGLIGHKKQLHLHFLIGHINPYSVPAAPKGT